jgi:hypothetical protein
VTYIHHIWADAHSIERLRQFVATYEHEHPNAISVHGAGPPERSCLIYASDDLSESLHAQGFDTWMCAVRQSRPEESPTFKVEY